MVPRVFRSIWRSLWHIVVVLLGMRYLENQTLYSEPHSIGSRDTDRVSSMEFATVVLLRIGLVFKLFSNLCRCYGGWFFLFGTSFFLHACPWLRASSSNKLAIRASESRRYGILQLLMLLFTSLCTSVVKVTSSASEVAFNVLLSCLSAHHLYSQSVIEIHFLFYASLLSKRLSWKL